MNTPTDTQLARIREVFTETVEEWARDYGQTWGKEHTQLVNRLVGAAMAMDQCGTITINSKAEEPEREGE